MGFGNFLKGLPVVGGLFESDNPQEDMQRQQDAIRESAKKKQYEYLDQMRGPVQAEAVKRRIAALDQDALEAQGPLSQNKYFQGERAQAVQGGQQALSGIQNKQRATGVTGGFSNIGSTQDAYDRLSGQLANIGSRAAERGQQARDESAQAQQGWEDDQLNFFNNQLKAKMGIEANDYNSAMDAIKQRYAGEQQQRAGNAQTRGSYTSAALAAWNPFGAKKLTNFDDELRKGHGG